MTNAQKDITALLGLVNSSVNKLVATYARASQPLPSLHGIAPAQISSLNLHNEMDIAVLAAACDQLKATFIKPEQELMALSRVHLVTAALQVAIEARVAEGLRQAPAEGVHVNVLAEPSGIDAQVLARCLRLLADYHVFREVSYESFAHTRLSLPLDTGKPIEVMFREPREQLYSGTNGVVAALVSAGDRGLRTSARLLDWLRDHHGKEHSAELDPSSGSAGWIAHTPFQLAFGTKETFWEWLGSRTSQQALFQAAMVGYASVRSFEGRGSGVVHDIPWNSLADGDLVVDVGGGAGSAFLPIIEACPHLRFIIQDLPDVEPRFNALWEHRNPHHLRSGRIKFQAHDFFRENPVSEAAVYHLRMILHDWPDSEAVKILSRLADAAGPASYVLITDFVAPVTASTTAFGNRSSSEHAIIPDIALLPTPLTTPTAHYGGVVHQFDLTMLANFSSAERTAHHWRNLLDEVGLKLVDVIPGEYFGSAKPGTLICIKT